MSRDDKGRFCKAEGKKVSKTPKKSSGKGLVTHIHDALAGDILVGIGCIKEGLPLGLFKKGSLDKPKDDMSTKAAKGQKPEGTPIDWKYADPDWIADLHDIYKDDCIPATEEELRADILDAMTDAYALIGGYMLYLKNKPKVKACTCKSKQGK